jgi:hypothetical protein
MLLSFLQKLLYVTLSEALPWISIAVVVGPTLQMSIKLSYQRRYRLKALSSASQLP